MVMMPEKQEFTFLAEGELSVSQGELNDMRPISLFNGKGAFLRTRKEEGIVKQTLRALDFEYEGLKYFSKGGGYRLRSLDEQNQFTQRCNEREIIVAGVEWLGEHAIVQHVKGRVLSEYLKGEQADLQVVENFLGTVLNAHQKGIVFGDRWTKNVIVTPDGQIVHVDFDIELEGDCRHEFEMAQAIYYVSLAKDEEAQDVIDKWFQDVLKKSNVYKVELVEFFFAAHKQLSETYPQMNP